MSHVLHRHDEESGLIVLESAVNLGHIEPHVASMLISDVPTRAKSISEHFSPVAQSGSETRVRLFFQKRRVPVTPQASIQGVGLVDLLVGRSWIIEADSVAHHAAAKNVELDCERDLVARAQGYTVTRLSFQQIWHRWGSTQDVLLRMLHTRRHLLSPRAL